MTSKTLKVDKTKKGASDYTSDNIETMRFPESVRKSPGMYIGGTDEYGKWITAKELLDNGLDEALAQRNDCVWLHLAKDETVWVVDKGHGIPQGTKTFEVNLNGKVHTNKMPTLQAVFGELHTSGKFRSDAYKVSVGTHGVGAKGTNATALFFKVWTYYKGQWYHIAFEKGKLTTPVEKCKAPKDPRGKTLEKGTLVKFQHDPLIFKKAKGFPIKLAYEWAEVMAYLTPRFKVIISQEGKDPKVYFSKNGPKDYIAARLAKYKVEAEKTLLEHHSDLADIVIAFANYPDCDLRGFTNGSANKEGGKHIDSVTGALYKALLADAKIKVKKTKKGERTKAPFTESDVKEGLVGLVNAKLHKAQFNSQDKVKLTDDRVGPEFEAQLTHDFRKFFKDNQSLAKRLRERALALNDLKNKFVASKKVVSELNKLKSKGMPAKYSPAHSVVKPADRELLIVEGDSAAGGIRNVRHPWQALLPLKGKVLNSLKDPKGKALESEEILHILGAIGYNPKAANPMEKLTTGKIICVADPDPDGPFVADTKIRIKPPATDGLDGIEPQERSIQELAEAGVSFAVPVWVGGAESWVNATARLVRNVDSLVALEIGGHKYKVSEDHRFMVVRTRASHDREDPADESAARGYVGHSETLAYIKAQNMRIGDRVWCPHLEQGKRDYNKQDKATGRGFMAVNKMRIQHLSEPVPVYCLEVPKYHHFVLPSGLVSANCHINSLLLSLFYKYLPDLFARGMIYVANAPEFYSKVGPQLVTGDTLSEVQKKLKKIKAPATAKVNHIKGWGEIDGPVLKALLLNSDSRRLIQIKAIEREDRTDFVRLMNDDVAFRREMLGLPQSAAAQARDQAKAKAKKEREAKAAKSEKAKAKLKGKKVKSKASKTSKKTKQVKKGKI